MKKYLNLTFLLLLTTLLYLADISDVGVAITAKETTPSSSIIITNSSTNWQSKITDSKKLNSFNYYWSQKKPLLNQKNQAYQWRYQLQILDNNNSTRWVYDPRGFAREVTFNQASQIYQFSTVRAFNRFLNALNDKGKK